MLGIAFGSQGYTISGMNLMEKTFHLLRNMTGSVWIVGRWKKEVGTRTKRVGEVSSSSGSTEEDSDQQE